MKKIFYRVLTCIFSVGLILCCFASENGVQAKEIDESQYYNWVAAHDDNMPSVGDVNVLVLMVNFPEEQYENQSTRDEVEALYFGDSHSVKASFDEYSYGKLKFHGEVMDWYTTKYSRDTYENGYTYNMILEEIIENSEYDIDWSKYDGNGDGVVDNLYFYIPDFNIGDKSSPWYPHATVMNKEFDGKTVMSYSVIPDKRYYLDGLHTKETILHETGHNMGLRDYYAETANWEYIYTINHCMMSDNNGDFVAFSKILLGWISPQEIAEEATIELEPIGENQSAAIVYFGGNKNSNNIYVLEYENRDGRGYENFADKGVRIFKLNVRKSDDGYFLASQIDQIKLIEQVAEGLQEGDELNAFTMPSTYLPSVDNDGNTYYEDTVINFKIGQVSDEKASVSISYVNRPEINTEFDTLVQLKNNRILLNLRFNQTITLEDASNIRIEGDNETIETKCRKTSYNPQVTNEISILSKGQCKEDTDYRVIIPSGAIGLAGGERNDEIVINIHTDKTVDTTRTFLKERYFDDVLNFFSTDDSVIYFAYDESKQNLCMYEIKNNEITCKKVIDQFEKKITSMCRVCNMDNGNYVVSKKDNGEITVYIIDSDLNINKIISEYEISYPGTPYVLGNNVFIQKDYKNCLIWDSDTKEISDIVLSRSIDYLDDITKFNSDVFFATNARGYYLIDMNGKILCEKEANRNVYKAEVKDDEIYLYTYGEKGIYLEIYDSRLELLAEKLIFGDYCGVKITPTATGYIAFGNYYDNGYIYGAYDAMSSKRIAYVGILNSDFSIASTVTLFNDDQYNDELKYATEISDGTAIVVSNNNLYTTSKLNNRKVQCIEHSYYTTSRGVSKCMICGDIQGEIHTEHIFVNNPDDGNHKCSICGEVGEHKSETNNTKATLKENGKLETKCNICGDVSSVKTIYYPKTFTLDKTSFEYTGSQIKPTIKVIDSKGKEISTSYYTVAYGTNKSVGKGIVKVSFKGNYSGTKTVEFSIVPKKTVIETPTIASNGITVKWSKNTSAKGYIIYRSVNGAAYEKVKTISDNTVVSWKDTTANVNGSKYQYKIVSYKVVDGVNYKSGYSSIKTRYFVSMPKISSLNNDSAGKMTVKWGKNSKATGYQIQYSTDAKFTTYKSSNVKSNTTVSRTFSKLTKGKKYYVRIRAYKTVGNTNYYSYWSSKYSVMITK